MTRIAIYGFSGRYSGPSGYVWEHSEAGEAHKCVLFFGQHSEASEYESVSAECRKHGLSNVEDMRFGVRMITAVGRQA